MPTKFNLRGDDIQIRLTRNGQLQRTIVDLKDGSITLKITKHFEGYIGRSSDSVDEQFNHVDVALNFHPSSQDALRLADDIKKRSQRQTAQDLLVINLIATLQFVDGSRPKIIVPDLKFGDIPLTFGGRDQYAVWSLDASAEDYTPMFT